MASRWAGTPGPGSGPGHATRYSPSALSFPGVERTTSGSFRDALSDDLLALLRRDPDPRVRHDGPIGMGNLEGLSD
jgi:hypothetical protein